MGANLTVLPDIKDLALKTETLEIEKRGKPNGPNLLANSVDESNQDMDILYQGQRQGGFNKGFKGGSTQNRGNGRDSRGGYRGNQRSTQNRGDQNNTQSKPQQNQQAPTPYRGNNKTNNNGERKTNPSGQQGQTGKWCANCRKITHNTAQCSGNKKKTVNDINDDDQQPQNELEDTPHCDTIQSFLQAKNEKLVPPKHQERINKQQSLKKTSPKQSIKLIN
jgi:hypothetical protein